MTHLKKYFGNPTQPTNLKNQPNSVDRVGSGWFWQIDRLATRPTCVLLSFFNAPHLNEGISFIVLVKKLEKTLGVFEVWKKKKILKSIKLFLKHGYFVFLFLTFIINPIMNFRKRNVMFTIFSQQILSDKLLLVVIGG